VSMVHVPYRGDALALTDLLSGQVQVYFGGLAAAIEQIRAGRLRALAVGTAIRLETLPNVPTLAETLSGYEASSWVGVGAPKGTPADVIDRLNKEINAGLADSSIITRLAELGLTVLPGSPADFSKLIADDTVKWAKVVRVSGVKPE
jgi:tripartite-type tricarboxylate transporter receptor subunit TctC